MSDRWERLALCLPIYCTGRMRNNQPIVWMNGSDKSKQVVTDFNQEILIEKKLVSMVRRELVVGNKTVLAFMDEIGLYYLHSAQAANLIEKKGSAIESYIVQNALSSQSSDLTKECTFQQLTSMYRNGLDRSRDWDPSIFVEDGNNKPFRVIPIKVVVDFAWFHLDKGNKQARDLVYIFSQESLEIRCHSVFSGVSSNVEETIKNDNHWLSSREMNQSVHGAFQQYCMSNHIPAAHAHNRMTKHVFNQTARMAIESNQLIGTDPSIGLDYQDSIEGQLLMAKMKVKFMSYKKGTWQERIDRCFIDSI